MEFPKLSTFDLELSVQVERRLERGPDAQLIVWAATSPDGRLLRVASVVGSSPVTIDGVTFVPAEATPMRIEPPEGWLARASGWFQRNEDIAWRTPSGHKANPAGDKQRGLALAWSSDSASLSEAAVQVAQPEATAVARLGANLLLVRGATAMNQNAERAAPQSDAEQDADQSEFALIQQAAVALENARQAKDRSSELLALIDLGSAHVRSNQAARGVSLLEQALSMARELGDSRSERDALGALGAGYLDMRRGDDAVKASEAALALAQSAGDRFTEKMMRTQIGNAWSLAMEPRTALRCFQAAYAIAEEQGDQRDMSDLLWRIAVCHDELNDHPSAIAAAEKSIALRRALGVPDTVDFIASLKQLRSRPPIEPPSAPAPSRLRMVLSAATALARFASSGFKKVAPPAREGRLEICNACEHHTGVRCRACGCFTAQKTWLPHERCPLNKWAE